jgi:uncharacterized SAM-binding protein YcdF (DUF218 family)
MSVLWSVLKTLVLPPLSCFVLALAGWLLGRRWPRLGRTLITTAILSLYLLATPWVSSMLLRSLQTFPALTAERLVQEAGAIVVLSGDYYRRAPEYGGDTVGGLTLERLRYGVRLFRDLHLPLLVSGGPLPGLDRALAVLMQETLSRDFQVPVRWLEAASQNTYENARFSAKILHEQGIHTVYLVTHSWHMPRAKAAFEACGIAAIPAPTRFTTIPTPELDDFLPFAGALNVSSHALYEWIGRLWYAVYYD